MHCKKVLLATIQFSLIVLIIGADLQNYRPNPKFLHTTKILHAADDVLLNKLDVALGEITNVYIQALFSGSHTIELDVRMRSLESEFFDLLNALYKEKRMSDYMRYESEVTRQMIIYNMLKKLFGYADEQQAGQS